jgi:uncharacterized protein YdaL
VKRSARYFAAATAILVTVAMQSGVPSNATAPARSGTLIVFEVDPGYPVWSESNATMTANLVGHFSRWHATKADDYVAGDALRYERLIYVGSRYRDRTLSPALLNDVLEGSTPTLWVGQNLWELSARQDAISPSFATRFGFTWNRFSNATEVFDHVTYRGRTVNRSAGLSGQPLLLTNVLSAPAQVLATATGPSVTAPWAIRSGSLTYIAELPFSFVEENDRYLVFADLLYDFYGISAAPRHRAIIRLEDVSPNSDPVALRAAVDQLAARNVPFGVHTIPFFVDPDLAHGGANPVRIALSDRPLLVAAVQYALAHGGELIMHGSTHQFGTLANPYNGLTGDDFEFFRAHVDGSNAVVLDGEIPGLTAAAAGQRLDDGLAEIQRVGLPHPALWTTPHYAATPAAYEAIGARFQARFERGLYFTGLLDGSANNVTSPFGQFYPYVVRDVYGQVVLPEDIGNETVAYNQHSARTVADILDNAQAGLIVRDGIAGAFWHPYLAATPAGASHLGQIIDGVIALGYTYVLPSSLIGEAAGGPDRIPIVVTTTTTTPTTTTTTTTTTTLAPTTTTTTTTTTLAPTTTTLAPTTTTTTTTTTTPTTTTTQRPRATAPPDGQPGRSIPPRPIVTPGSGTVLLSQPRSPARAAIQAILIPTEPTTSTALPAPVDSVAVLQEAVTTTTLGPTVLTVQAAVTPIITTTTTATTPAKPNERTVGLRSTNNSPSITLPAQPAKPRTQVAPRASKLMTGRPRFGCRQARSAKPGAKVAPTTCRRSGAP